MRIFISVLIYLFVNVLTNPPDIMHDKTKDVMCVHVGLCMRVPVCIYVFEHVLTIVGKIKSARFHANANSSTQLY